MTHAALALLLAIAGCGSALAGPLAPTAMAAYGDALQGAQGATLTTAYPGDAGQIGAGVLYIDDLEGAAGLNLPSGTLGADAFEGSAATWAFHALAGQILSFDWALTATDGVQVDRLHVLLDGVELAQYGLDGTVAAGHFSHALALGGSHTLAVALVDVGDVDGLSVVALDQLSLVPEPGGLALSGLALAGLAAARRRQRSAAR